MIVWYNYYSRGGNNYEIYKKVELPHKDTIQLVINELDYNELKEIQTKIIKKLIRC